MKSKFLKCNIAFLLLAVLLITILLPLTADAAVKLSAPKTLYVDIGGTAQINIKTTPVTDLATLGVSFTTGNETIATVDSSGLVNGIGKGSTTITVKYGKKTFKVNVLVSEACLPYTANPAFSIAYPQSWLVTEDLPIVNVGFSAPLSNPNDSFYENITVTVNDMPEAPALQKITDYAILSLKKSLLDFKIVSSKKMSLGGQKAHAVTFTCHSGFSPMKAVQILAVKNDRLYVICYTAEKNSFDQYDIEIQKMLSSFKILG